MYFLKQILVLVLILPSFSSGNALNDSSGNANTRDVLSFPVEKPQNLKQSIDGIDMLLLPGGCYLYPEITDYEDKYTDTCVEKFWLGVYEVTQEQWQKIMGKNPAFFKKCGKRCPIEQVSWDDIQLFLTKLNQITGKKYRLPSDTEWMYACLAGQSGQKYCGHKNSAESIAWFNDNSHKKPQEVGQKAHNQFGLYDMNGNVWEWVSDRYVDKLDLAESATDGKTRNKLVKRIYKGGSWHDSEWRLRLTFQIGDQADYKSNTLGFRLALDPSLNEEK